MTAALLSTAPVMAQHVIWEPVDGVDNERRASPPSADSPVTSDNESAAALLHKARLHVDMALSPGRVDRDFWLRHARRVYTESLRLDVLVSRDAAHARRAIGAIDVLLSPVVDDEPELADVSGEERLAPIASQDSRELDDSAEPSSEERITDLPVVVSPMQIAWSRGCAALWAMHDHELYWEQGPEQSNALHRHGATALAVMALRRDVQAMAISEANESANGSAWQQAKAALRQANPDGTFAAAFVAMATDRDKTMTAEAWSVLGPGMNTDGRWGPGTNSEAAGATPTHTLAAVWSLVQAGQGSGQAEAEETKRWQRLAAYLVLRQSPDGGWPDPWKSPALPAVGDVGSVDESRMPWASDPTASVMSRYTLELVAPFLAVDVRRNALQAIDSGDDYLHQALDVGANPMPGRYRNALPWVLVSMNSERFNTRFHAMAQRWLIDSQHEDGSWGGAAETAMALLALEQLIDRRDAPTGNLLTEVATDALSE